MISERRAGVSRWRALAGPLAAGALAGLGHPPFDLWFLTPLGLAVGIWFLGRCATPWAGFRAGLALGTGYFAVALHWIVEPFLVDAPRYGWMAPFALVLMALGMALFWAVAFWGVRRMGRATWPVVPLLALGELARAYLFGGFPWAMPSYVFVNGLTGQAAAWIGPHGVNVILFALALAGALALRGQGRARWPGGLVLAAGIAISALPVLEAPLAGPEAQVVRLIQPNAPQDQKWDPAYMRMFFERSVAFTGRGAQRPDLIVWPETSVPILLNRADTTLAVIAEAAAGAQVVLGINRLDGERAYNSAIRMDGQGVVTDVYDKHHLVPFGEYIPLGDLLGRFGLSGLASRDGNGFSAGPGPRLMDLGPVGRALPLICYEAVFPQDVNGAPERPDLLLQITNDAWFGNFSGPYQHLAQARMRAIEQGLPMLRAANTGVSAAIDARGRVVASLPLNEDGFLDVALPPKLAPTLYPRTGDLPLAVLLAILTAVLAVRARRESN